MKNLSYNLQIQGASTVTAEVRHFHTDDVGAFSWLGIKCDGHECVSICLKDKQQAQALADAINAAHVSDEVAA